jgi:hypothetical protein
LNISSYRLFQIGKSLDSCRKNNISQGFNPQDSKSKTQKNEKRPDGTTTANSTEILSNKGRQIAVSQRRLMQPFH